MSRNIIIFNELVGQIPELVPMLRQRGLEVVEVPGGRDAFRLAQEQLAAAVFLDVAMPQMSGIECCRQLKEAGGVVPKIVLISAISSATIAQRAEDAGCDLFVHQEEAQERLPAFIESQIDSASGGALPLRPSAKPSPEAGEEAMMPSDETYPTMSPTRSVAVASPGRPDLISAPSTSGSHPRAEGLRRAPRHPVPKTIHCELADAKGEAELINISKNGILFSWSSAPPVNTPATVRIDDLEGGIFELRVVTVRTIKLKQAQKDHPFGVGARFLTLGAEEVSKIKAIAQARAEEKGRPTLKLAPDFVRRFLDAKPEILRPVVEGESTDPSLLELYGDRRSLEEEGFKGKDELSDCIRRAVLYRVQCAVLYTFLPTIRAGRGVYAAPFLPYLQPLLKRSDAIAEEIDTHAQKAMEYEEDEKRQGLNELSNRLAQWKEQLIFGVNEMINPEGLGPQAEIVEAVQERAVYLKSLRQGAAEELKFGRRRPPPPMEEPKKKETSILSKRPLQIVVALLVVVVLGSAAWGFLASRVSQTDLEIPLAVTKGVKDDAGLVLHSTREAWNSLSKENQGELFAKLETYLRKERMRQCKIVDENGKMLAAILGGRAGRNWAYSHRIYR